MAIVARKIVLHITFIAICLLIITKKSRGSDNSFSDGEEIGVMIVGTITNTNLEDNVALIKEIKTGRIRAVKNNHEVLDFKVSEVTTKYIILSKDGKKYLVYQNKFAGEFAGGTKKVVFQPASNQMTGNFSEVGFERKDGKISVSQDYLSKLVKIDLSKILMQATAIPKVEDGEIIGFLLVQIDANSIFDKAGFRDNDIITSINGNKLNSVAGAIKILKAVQGEAFVEVDLLRSGSPQKMQISVVN